MSKDLARRKLVAAVVSSISAELYAETHPGDPNLDAESEYNDKRIDETARKLVEELGS